MSLTTREPEFRYSLEAPKPVVPSLDQLLFNKYSVNDYSREGFAEFLSSIHCLENLEFVVEINSYLTKDVSEQFTMWPNMYSKFLEKDAEKEVNIPSKVKGLFQEDEIPRYVDLQIAKSLISDILLDLYYEYVRWVKSSQMSRRQSEPIPSERNESPEVPWNPNSIVASTTTTSTSSGRKSASPLTKDSDFAILDSEDNSSSTVMGRKNSSSASSRGSSIGSIVDNLVHSDYINLKKTVRKFRIRRFSNQDNM